ncbi:MAG: ROK family transcriptional regulator [Alkalispirochaeta sp.]
MNRQSAVTGDMDLVKQTNRGLILNQLIVDGPLSRAELSRKVGVSRSTCSSLVDELLRHQLVIELGKDRSSGGRRPTLVNINYHAGQAIGIKVMADSIVGALVDLTGGIVNHNSRTFDTDGGHEACVAAIVDLAQELSGGNDASADREPIIGIGIGMGGRIDYQSGTLIESSVLPWKDVPLASLVAAETGVPVYLENDVNTFALGENHFGQGKSHRDYLCLSIGRGIGAGIVIDGRLYKGAHHGAGEFGHTKLIHGADARRCSCGEYGCLEAYASTPAIVAEAGRRFGREITVEELSEMARAGDSVAVEIFGEAGTVLGIGISTLINMLDPELVLIGGEGTAYSDLMQSAVEKSIATNTVYSLAEEIPVRVLPYQADMWARGLATVVMMERLQVTF